MKPHSVIEFRQATAPVAATPTAHYAESESQWDFLACTHLIDHALQYERHMKGKKSRK
ncbi:MAG: hypothetical protein H6581_08820 [Bacteroidia bacterium]|nr:hypothetical protein [Bacteroidia bacterium]